MLLVPGQIVKYAFYVLEKYTTQTRDGYEYGVLTLSSNSTLKTAYVWEGHREILKSISEGDNLYVVAKGVETKNGVGLRILMVSQHIDQKLDAKRRIKWRKLLEILDLIRDCHLRALINYFLVRKDFLEAFVTSRAGFERHHTTEGGLLDHTVSLMELALLMIELHKPFYLNRDLLFTGAFLHDIGKTECFRAINNIPLLRHPEAGLIMVNRAVSGIDNFPNELAERLYNIVAYHHERPRHTKKVRIPECIVISHLDALDAEIDRIKRIGGRIKKPRELILPKENF
ncbi:MAG: HD domain-containing protein [Deltaproteobacteria bacterium]|nr:HD domain-containing protein [Deltaproteobacteria bacterium]